jgi:hypothetical protein
MPLRPKLGYTPTKGTLGICLRNTIGRMPGDRNQLSLDTFFVIPTCVLRFEVSELRRRTPVGLALLTGQIGLELLQLRLWFFGLGFVDQPRNPMVFW